MVIDARSILPRLDLQLPAGALLALNALTLAGLAGGLERLIDSVVPWCAGIRRLALAVRIDVATPGSRGVAKVVSVRAAAADLVGLTTLAALTTLARLARLAALARLPRLAALPGLATLSRLPTLSGLATLPGLALLPLLSLLALLPVLAVLALLPLLSLLALASCLCHTLAPFL